MTSRPSRRSPLAVVVLALLAESPMHVYRMQQLIKERGKDQVVNVAQRNSIYQTIDRLRRAGLVEVQETSRDERWPERTIYRATEEGSATLHDWLREMLSERAREFPEFPAALAFAALLSPQQVRGRLEERAATLEQNLAEYEARQKPPLPRIFLVEDEYLAAMTKAELSWLRGMIAELREGALSWDVDALMATHGEKS